MNKINLSLLVCLLVVFSCKPDHKQPHQDKMPDFELIRIGFAEHPDTINRDFIGAAIYITNVHEDSIYVKIHEISPETGEPDSISRSYMIWESEKFKKTVNDAILFIDSADIKDGEVPGTNPGPEAIYCGGSYIFTYINKAGQRRCFSFRHHHLPEKLERLLNEQYEVREALDHRKPGMPLFYNTDSITRYYFSCFS